jgi:hypothetical protein
MRALLLGPALALGACLSPPGPSSDAGPTGGDGLRTRLVTLRPPAVGMLGAVPLAIILEDDADLAAAAREDGADIRVGDGPRGSELPHEIEAWDPATGSLVLWVLVPIVQDGTVLELRYGDGMERPQSPQAVWLSYTGVWHLAGDPTSFAPQMVDSTGRNPGSVVGSPPASVPGVAGPALGFDGTGVIRISDDSSLDFPGASFSYELWVDVPSVASAGEFDMPWYKGGANEASIGYDMELGAGQWYAFLNDGVVARSVELSVDPIIARWTHLVAVVDREGDTLRAYVDGVAVAEAPLDPLGELSSEIDALIGGGSLDDNLLIGSVDEVRVRGGTPDEAEIAVRHANLRAPSAFLEIGEEEPAP